MTATARGPAGYPAVRAAAGESAVVVRWLAVALFASIFLQRFAIPGSGGIGANLLVTLTALAALGLRGVLRVDPLRAVLFLALACWAALSMAANAAAASVDSVLLMLVLYAPFTLSLRPAAPLCGDVVAALLRIFQVMVLVAAVCGMVQYLAQFVWHGLGLFSFQGVVPDQFLVPNYNTVIPLRYGATIYKSNGFFFLEPSTFSQYLSLAILFEVLFWGVTPRLAVFGVALLLTYSGTGPMMLLILLPCLILYRRSYALLLGLAVFAALAVATGKLWHMDALLQRTNEFGQQGTSATARFVSSAWLIADTMHWTPHDLLFGLGPGTISHYGRTAEFEVADPTWGKLLFEYGLGGAIVFWSFFCHAVFARAPSRWVAAALSIGFLIFGGMLLDPRLNTLILLFCILPKPPGLRRGAAAAGQDSSSPSPSRTLPAIALRHGGSSVSTRVPDNVPGSVRGSGAG